MLNKLSITLLLFCTAVMANTNPKLIDVPLHRTYVPIGFDSNDRIQVVVVGEFPNTCYQVGPHFVSVDTKNKVIKVKQKAYLYGGTCLKVTVPFYQVIDAGIVPVGDYKIEDVNSKKRLGLLPVKLATNPGPGPDDFTYAPVTDSIVYKNYNTGEKALVLFGTFTNRCMRLKDVKINYYEDVLVVQPIAETFKDPEVECEGGLFRFKKEVPLKEEASDNFLLHVRAMNGQAINKLISLDEIN